jgi:hypothetical protein
MEGKGNPGFHLRRSERDPHVCPRCGGYAPYNKLCGACQVSQVPYAGYIFARRVPEVMDRGF